MPSLRKHPSLSPRQTTTLPRPPRSLPRTLITRNSRKTGQLGSLAHALLRKIPFPFLKAIAPRTHPSGQKLRQSHLGSHKVQERSCIRGLHLEWNEIRNGHSELARRICLPRSMEVKHSMGRGHLDTSGRQSLLRSLDAQPRSRRRHLHQLKRRPLRRRVAKRRPSR